jgi:hypothetical protein
MATVQITYRPELMNPPMEAPIAFGIHNKKMGAFDTYTFKPGEVTTLPEEIWQTLRQRPSVTELLDYGALREHRADLMPTVVPEPEQTQGSTTKGHSVEACADLIARSVDPQELARWAATDRRVTVQNMCRQRIQQIEEGRA